MKKTRIIGISAYFHDSAVGLLEDGKIIYAAQEERFTRNKHDASFPINALKDLLRFNKLKLKAVGQADNYPVSQDNAKNRRVEVTFKIRSTPN